MAQNHLIQEPEDSAPLLPPPSNEDPVEQFRRQSAMARQNCQVGRKFLQDGDHTSAAKQFSKTVMTFEYILKNNAKQVQLKGELAVLYKQIIRPSYSNLALCYLKLKKWGLVLTFTNQVLKDDSANIKNLYRRGIAQKQQKLFDEAIADFQKVITLDRQMDIQCKNLIKECKNGKKQLKAKEKQIARKLIANYAQNKPEPKPVQEVNSGQNKQDKQDDQKGRGSSLWSKAKGWLRACCKFLR